MAEILVLVEHAGDAVKKVNFELLTLARKFGEPAAVWTGPGAEDDVVIDQATASERDVLRDRPYRGSGTGQAPSAVPDSHIYLPTRPPRVWCV